MLKYFYDESSTFDFINKYSIFFYESFKNFKDGKRQKNFK